MIGDFFILALKNLRRRKLRSWLTVIGILIGITAVVALITLGNGLKDAVNSQFGISSTELISVQAGGLNAYGPPGSGAVNPLIEEDVNEIEKLNLVENAVRRNVRQGKLEFNDIVIFGYMTNIPNGEDRDFVYEQLDVDVEQGRLLKDGDTRKVVVGNNFLTDSVGLEKEVYPGNTVKIQDVNFEVVGILEKKGSFIFDNMVLMNEEQMQNLLDYGDEVDIIGVKVKDKRLMDKAKEDIEKLLRKRRDVDIGEEDFEVSTPQAALETVNQILTGIQIFIVIIALISTIVGAIGIANTMATSVLERRKEIGVMKSIGARNAHIFQLFLIESGLVGLIGGIVGIVFGSIIGFLGITWLNNFLGASSSPGINIPLMVLTLLGSFLIGAISGIVPAIQAAKEKPVDALRG